MEFGDLSSLSVEYPDYNSLGLPLIPITTLSSKQLHNKGVKIQETLQIPLTINGGLASLAGRALIVTRQNDLVAYGILVNESDSRNTSLKIQQGQTFKAVALCESNKPSIVMYRALFNLEQTGTKVTFDGMMRTSQKMDDDDELIVSLNYKQAFDLDFDDAYFEAEDLSKQLLPSVQPMEPAFDYVQYMHPCYKIKEETVSDQDWILGRDLMMFGQNDHYPTSAVKILETSKCHIGLANPTYRISDESFCRQSLIQS